jgi:hypothetical protein
MATKQRCKANKCSSACQALYNISLLEITHTMLRIGRNVAHSPKHQLLRGELKSRGGRSAKPENQLVAGIGTGMRHAPTRCRYPLDPPPTTRHSLYTVALLRFGLPVSPFSFLRSAYRRSSGGVQYTQYM